MPNLNGKLSDPAYRWDLEEVAIDDQTLLDLSTWFRIDPRECLNRIDDYRMTEMADAWSLARPVTPRQIRRFYRETDLCIWELAKWHAGGSYQIYQRRVQWLIEKYPPATHPRALDFGCGIGTAALWLAEAGYRVTLADVPGRTLEFAVHRFRRRSLPCDIIKVTRKTPVIRGRFDIALSFDVMEHIPEPERAVFAIAGALRTGGVATIIADFENHGLHPQHLQANIDRFKRLSWNHALELAGLKMNQNDLLEKEEVRSMLARKLRWRRYAGWE